jgi:hypothetical protein
VPFIEKLDDLASDFMLHETSTLFPPIFVRTEPPPVHCPSIDFKKSFSEADALEDRKIAQVSAMAGKTRMLESCLVENEELPTEQLVPLNSSIARGGLFIELEQMFSLEIGRAALGVDLCGSASGDSGRLAAGLQWNRTMSPQFFPLIGVNAYAYGRRK